MTSRRTVLKAFAATPLLLVGCATRYSTTPPGVLNVFVGLIGRRVNRWKPTDD